MAKVGLDYFPFDVCLDDKLKMIEAEFGLTGFGVIVKLWQKIYGGDGYYCKFDEEVALLFAGEVKAGVNVVSEIVNAAVGRGIFDKGLYEKYGILTSHGIQVRYLEAASRRVRVAVEERYLLLSVHEIRGNVDIIEENVYRNAKNVCRNRQSKVEESKVEYSKGEYGGRTQKKYGVYENVLLSDGEFESLRCEFPDDYRKRIDKLSEYMEVSGRKYGSHLAVIRKWAKEDRRTEMRKNVIRKSTLCNFKDTDTTDYAALEEELLEEIKNAEC